MNYFSNKLLLPIVKHLSITFCGNPDNEVEMNYRIKK